MSDYTPRHDIDTIVRTDFNAASNARFQVGRVARVRRFQKEYEPSIHSMEDDAPAWDDPHAGYRARAMIERRTQHPEDCALSDEFVHPA